MLLLAKVFSGTLLALSLPVAFIAIVQIVNPETTTKDREDAVSAFVFLSGISGFSAYAFNSTIKAQNKKRQDRLMASFFELVKKDKGRISPLSFAMKTSTNGQDAKNFLDARSNEFNGRYDVSENGDIFYVFDALGQR